MPGGWESLVGLEIPRLNRMPVVRTLPGSSSPPPLVPTPHFNIWRICGYILWTCVSFLIPIASYKQNVVSTIIVMNTEHTRNGINYSTS